MASRWDQCQDPLRQKMPAEGTPVKPKVSARLPLAKEDWLWGDLRDIEFAVKRCMWGYLKTAIFSLPRKALDGDERIKAIVVKIAEDCPDKETREIAKKRLADESEHLPGLFEKEKTRD